MNKISLKTLVIAATAAAVLAVPAIGSAQRWPTGNQNQGRWNQGNQGRWNDNRSLRELVARTERESNSFRSYFEHNFRSNGHGKHNDRYQDNDHADHQGRRGEMTLKDAIQNLDEAMERLRNAVNSNARGRRMAEIVDDISEHSRDVDQRIGRVSDSYDFFGGGSYNRNGGAYSNRDWRYDRSDLSRDWSELKRDINQLVRILSGRDGW